MEDINILIDDLERLRDGANVHTINKAISYLRSLSKPVWYIENDAVRQEAFKAHVHNCRRAVASKDVTMLAYAMRKWF